MNHRLGMRVVGVLAGALAVSGCMTQLLLGGGAIAATRLLGGPEWRHDAFAGALFAAAAPAAGLKWCSAWNGYAVPAKVRVP